MFHGRRDISINWETGHSILWEKRHFILWETGHSILWERFYPLGIGTLILWELVHLSSGNRDILRESGLGERDTLSSGNRDTYPLGNILWELEIWEMSYNRYKGVHCIGAFAPPGNSRECWCNPWRSGIKSETIKIPTVFSLIFINF